MISTDSEDMIQFYLAHLTVVYSSVYYRSACATPSGSPCSSQQSVYSPTINDPQAGIIAPKIHSSWNPFEDDSFSKLTVEELLHKDFAKLPDSKHRVSVLVYRIEESLHEPKFCLFFFWTLLQNQEKGLLPLVKISFQVLMLFQVLI